jgi:ABC-type oligopeptide transport system substrate-binding subunit
VAPPRLTLALALLVLATSIAGCGGGDSTSSTAGASGATGASSTDDPAADADAKVAARNAQVALETYATTTNGSYAGADVAGLSDILPSLAKADLTVTADASTYTVDVVSTSGVTFSVARSKDGAVDYICEPPGTGGCPDTGDWS